MFLSSAIFLAIYVNTDRKERISRADAQLQRTLDNQQEIIESWAHDRMSQLENLSELDEVVAGDKDSIFKTFQRYISFSLELEALFYIDEAGDIVIDSTSDSIEPTYQLNVKDKPYFQYDQGGITVSEEMYIRLQDETNVILFTSPVYGEDDQFQGIVLGAVNLDTINNLLKRTNLGISGETYIVNTDTELLLEVGHEQFDDKRRTEIHTAVIDAILEQKEPPKTYTDTRGDEVLGHYNPLFDDLFYIIHEIKVEEILKTHDKMVKTILLLGASIILAALLLIWFVLRDIQRSIANFTEAISTIQKGNYNYKIDKKTYENSALEIKEGIDIFDSMTETIRSNRQELTRLTEVDALTEAYNRRTFVKD